jgi:3-hydroxyanthranilate 3,4-dioxygenase
MHKADMTIMFIGGPNTREDYHLDLGSEFFFQMKGDMELPTIQRGERVVVRIREGEVFLLPSRIPHSPQRKLDTFGLVIERRRDEDELDGLRWYRDFTKPAEVLWDQFFYCGDLERDLVPVVKQYKSSAEANDAIPRGHVTVRRRRQHRRRQHLMRVRRRVRLCLRQRWLLRPGLA